MAAVRPAGAGGDGGSRCGARSARSASRPSTTASRDREAGVVKLFRRRRPPRRRPRRPPRARSPRRGVRDAPGAASGDSADEIAWRRCDRGQPSGDAAPSGGREPSGRRPDHRAGAGDRRWHDRADEPARPRGPRCRHPSPSGSGSASRRVPTARRSSPPSSPRVGLAAAGAAHGGAPTDAAPTGEVPSSPPTRSSPSRSRTTSRRSRPRRSIPARSSCPAGRRPPPAGATHPGPAGRGPQAAALGRRGGAVVRPCCAAGSCSSRPCSPSTTSR